MVIYGGDDDGDTRVGDEGDDAYNEGDEGDVEGDIMGVRECWPPCRMASLIFLWG